MMRKTVLLVEDDFDTLHPLAELLRLKGYDVITSSNAEQAASLLRTTSPDIIITDIVLPGKSGLHFITTVRNNPITSSIPLLVISGCGPMILVEAEAAGADLCLEKPINIDDFWSALNTISGRTQEPENTTQESADRPGLASQIDELVGKLRDTSSKDERETALKQLKEYILELQKGSAARRG